MMPTLTVELKHTTINVYLVLKVTKQHRGIFCFSNKQKRLMTVGMLCVHIY